MDQRFDKLEDKVDRLLESQALMKGELQLYNSLLGVHIKRSERLETLVDELFKFKYYVTGALVLLSPILATLSEYIKQWITTK